MPLTETGKSVLDGLIKKHGVKKGKEIFYAMINEKKKGSESWHVKDGV
jgi:hypothetical protein